MFFAKIPRHTRQNAITEGDSECILTRNCEGTEQLLINNYCSLTISCKVFAINMAKLQNMQSKTYT